MMMMTPGAIIVVLTVLVMYQSSRKTVVPLQRADTVVDDIIAENLAISEDTRGV